jgi:hypothetical protein
MFSIHNTSQMHLKVMTILPIFLKKFCEFHPRVIGSMFQHIHQLFLTFQWAAHALASRYDQQDCSRHSNSLTMSSSGPDSFVRNNR